MHDKRGNTGNVRRLQRAAQSIAQQRGAQPGLMVVWVNRQTPEQHDRNRVRSIATQAARRFGVSERTGRQAAVTDNRLTHAHDAGA